MKKGWRKKNKNKKRKRYLPLLVHVPTRPSSTALVCGQGITLCVRWISSELAPFRWFGFLHFIHELWYQLRTIEILFWFPRVVVRVETFPSYQKFPFFVLFEMYFYDFLHFKLFRIFLIFFCRLFLRLLTLFILKEIIFMNIRFFFSFFRPIPN